MQDAVVSASLHLQQLKPYDDKRFIETIDHLNIDLLSALDRHPDDLSTYRSKYMLARIEKPFRDTNTGMVRPFKGTVSDVHFSRDDGCYLFHIDYDSDSDDEEFELWELKNYITETHTVT